MFYISSFFFFNDTATTEIYTLSLHDALPIWVVSAFNTVPSEVLFGVFEARRKASRPSLVYCGDNASSKKTAAQLIRDVDRKSTRLNSSHSQISYAVFCLKKKRPRQHI